MSRGPKVTQEAAKALAEIFGDVPGAEQAAEIFGDDLNTVIGQARAYMQTGAKPVYPASGIKRHRATAAEMEERARFLIDYAREHAPVTVRGLYYQAEVAGLPGIDKTENSYSKVQHQVLQLRREGRIDYSWIADGTRWMRKPPTFDSWRDALKHTARTYRRSLWQDADAHVEVWIEKDALAGVILSVTSEFDVPLMVSRGFTSETFAYECINTYQGSDRPLVVYALYDFDRSGWDAASSLDEKLVRFGADLNVDVLFNLIGVTPAQIEGWALPTRPHKRTSPADKRWPYVYACELDAIPPDELRALVQSAIEQHLPAMEFSRLKRIEAAERDTLVQFMEGRA